ncbi:MAG: hypothetical protein ISR95_00300 [Candidatus Marinimicrobia bacterium]|nr:hypothetical protein [Candidatus Neomarinimicrobiota bacterium]MBL7046071.1 hypothetical protein [Candidatus Neomarinimicrobiota bacterium]
MSDNNKNKMEKVESVASVGSAILSTVLVVFQVVGLFRGRPISKIK